MPMNLAKALAYTRQLNMDYRAAGATIATKFANEPGLKASAMRHIGGNMAKTSYRSMMIGGGIAGAGALYGLGSGINSTMHGNGWGGAIGGATMSNKKAIGYGAAGLGVMSGMAAASKFIIPFR